MDEGSRIDALLQAAGLEARASGASGAYGGTIDGGTTARVVPLADARGRPLAVAKLADASVDDRRIDAEAHVLAVLRPRHDVPAPALLARRGRDLLLEWAQDLGGSDDPAAMADLVLEALVRVHRVRPTREEAAVLAGWGRGTADREAAFARRTRRLERRIDGFLALLPAATAERWRPRLERLGRRHEEACRIVAGLGGDRLIHGDLHRGNVRRGAAGVILIDWQQASIGHPLVDLVRWLAEHGPGDATTCRRLAWEHARTVAVPIDEVGLDALLDTTLGGLISGFGGRTPRSLRSWERTVIAHALQERGWLCTHAAG